MTSDQRAKITRIPDVVVERFVAEHDVAQDAIAIGNFERRDRSAIRDDRNFNAVIVREGVEINLDAIGASCQSVFALCSQFAEDSICFFQSFDRTDIKPETRHFPHIKRHARVQPLDQSAGLVRIVSFRDVLMDQRQR